MNGISVQREQHFHLYGYSCTHVQSQDCECYKLKY